MPLRVIFTTTVFDEVQTGPGMYARYLWEAFRDDPDLEFHLAVLSAGLSHPRLHVLDEAGRADGLCHGIGLLGRALAVGRERETIVHGNAAHSMFDFVDYPGPWLVQVNDYEVANLWRHAYAKLARQGLRRVASLAWRRRQEKKVIPAATRVVCNSGSTREAVLGAYRVDERKVVTIHKAVDVSEFARPGELPVDPLTGRQPGTRLAFVGTNWPIKGLDILLRALPAVAAKFPGATLIVVGPVVTKGNARVKALCGKLGLSDRVFFLGRVQRSALPRLLWHSDVFVLPSRQEAFGVAVIEALAAGVPVVAARVGGIPEIIRNDGEGILHAPDEPAALAQTVIGLLSDEKRRKLLAAAGPVRAKDFGAAKMAANVKKLYLHVARESGIA